MSEAHASSPGAGWKAGAPSNTIRQRPLMHKRVERKDDGRILIYYTFDAAAEKDRQQTSNQATEGAKK